MDEEKLSGLIQQGKYKIRNERLDKDDLLFTENPQSLQQKLRELEKFPVVFAQSTLFRAKN